jgi:hypothetical protein
MKLFLFGLLLLSNYAFANSEIDKVCKEMEYKDCSLVKAIIKVESNGNPLSIGHDGAGSLGLMQVKCATAWALDKYHKRKQVRCKELFNPKVNVRYGIEYLNYIEKRLSTKPSTIQLLSAYNAGFHYEKSSNRYMVKKCNAISIKKNRKCKKGEPFNIEYSRKVIQAYNKITRSNSNVRAEKKSNSQ